MSSLANKLHFGCKVGDQDKGQTGSMDIGCFLCSNGIEGAKLSSNRLLFCAINFLGHSS